MGSKNLNLSSPPGAQRRAKIVCTLGPASNTESMIRDLLRCGMDVARLNFSHGTHEEHARVIERLRKVAKAEHRTICILQDLQGPKMRTGELKDDKPLQLVAGDLNRVRQVFGKAWVSHLCLRRKTVPTIQFVII